MGADRDSELPDVAETAEQAREILDLMTATREALGMAALQGLVVATYAILVSDLSVALVSGLTVAYTVGAVAMIRHFGREAKRRTAPFRNPVDGQLRGDVPGQTLALRATRRRLIWAGLAADGAILGSAFL